MKAEEHLWAGVVGGFNANITVLDEFHFKMCTYLDISILTVYTFTMYIILVTALAFLKS